MRRRPPRDPPRDPPATAVRYRGPDQVPGGGVLAVGASASGVQIADELRRAGRPVVTRRACMCGYRAATGAATSVVDGPGRGPGPDHRPGARRTVGPPGAVAAAIGPATARSAWIRCRRAGEAARRLVAADGLRLSFADDLPATIGGAQARMERLLRTIDGYLARSGGEAPARLTRPRRSPRPPSRPGSTCAGPHQHGAVRRPGHKLENLAAGSRPGPARRDRPPPRRDQASPASTCWA